MKHRKELKALSIFVLGISFFYWGYKFLSTGSFFEDKNLYHAIYSKVDELHTGSPVTLNGVNVGIIRDINFITNGKLIISFTLNNNGLSLSKKTKAFLTKSGLIGSKIISIIPELEHPEKLKPGDTLISETSVGIQDLFMKKINPSIVKINKLVDNIDSVFVLTNRMLHNENKEKPSVYALFEKINTSMYHVNRFTYNINTMSDEITNIIKNVNLSSTAIKEITKDLQKSNIKKSFYRFDTISRNLAQISNEINSKKGSIGLFIKDPDLYNNLNESSIELKKLLEDIKEYPYKYTNISIFGKKNKKPKEKENTEK